MSIFGQDRVENRDMAHLQRRRGTAKAGEKGNADKPGIFARQPGDRRKAGHGLPI